MHRRHRHFVNSREIVNLLLAAYREGAFPMADPETGRIDWYTTEWRGILPLDMLHVPRSVERRIRQRDFILTSDTAFEQVMRGCAETREHTRRLGPDEAPGTWINDELIEWYGCLFEAGHAHSLEAWRVDPERGELRLVGGIYGVSIGAAFFAESKFCRPRERQNDGARHPLDGTDASKVCLVELARHLHTCGYQLFDTQFTNPHIARFGVVEMQAGQYQSLLKRAVAQPDPWRTYEQP